MKEGKLVPDELMIDLVAAEAAPHMEQGLSLLLDGFPRTVAQAESLKKTVPVNMVINLDIPTETIVARLADRYVRVRNVDVFSAFVCCMWLLLYFDFDCLQYI